MRWVVIVPMMLLLAGCATLKGALKQPSRELTLQDVIDLTKAEASDEVIMSQIDATGSHFKLSTQDIKTLKEAGVSNKVIEFMIDTEIWGFRYYTYPWYERFVYAQPYYPIPSLLHPRYRYYRPWVYGGVYRGYYTPYYLPYPYYYHRPYYEPYPQYQYPKNPYYYRWPTLERPAAESSNTAQ
ncbi:MAG TPA: hypothetical protein EYP53_08285 [Candidatus Latescibacteria bacterium]|nr:hypothetical protein [Candidatus Latescibacterota bacterium]